MTPGPRGIVLCDDLLFASRVTATARAAGLPMTVARSPEAVLAAAREHPPTGLIVDLHVAGLDVPALLAGLRAICPAMPRAVGVGSHVDADRLKAARRAGVDPVLARSQFADRLEADLPAWLAPAESSEEGSPQRHRGHGADEGRG